MNIKFKIIENIFFQKSSFPRPASATHLSLDKQFRAAAVAAANTIAATEPTLPDANDDEISQITSGKEKQTKKLDEKIDFGLPDHGAFSDPHDSQRQDGFGDRKASISTQDDFGTPDVLNQTLSAGNTSSFEPTSARDAPMSSNFGDQQNVKTTGKEQS